jgi:hypothetical protein
MVDPRDMSNKAAALRALMEAKLGARGRDLQTAVRRAGRRLPRRVRKQAQMLARTERMVGHPKVSRQVDARLVEKAFASVTDHLQQIDVADRRRGRLLSLAGALAFNVLAVAAGFVFYMWWRGYL